MAESSVLSLFLVTGVICMFYCPVLGDYNALQTGQANGSQSDICKHCLAFMQDEINLLKNETFEEQIVAEIVKVCKILGWPVCVDNVEEYGVLFISYIADDLVPADVCNGVGFCKNEKTTTKGEQLAKPHLKSSGNPCADCEAFMTDLRNLLNNRTLEKTVVEKLKELCKLFNSVECSNYVEDYGMAAMNYLKDHFVPKNVCMTLKSCPQSQNLVGKQIPSIKKFLRIL